ncbi:MAG: DUF1109 domain-containing protein [Hyphomonadaceae bacterium]
MKTDDLIAMMASDTKPVARGSIPRKLSLVGAAGALVALVILIPWLGLRDMGLAIGAPSYWMKTIYTLGLGVGGLLLTERLARPGASWVRGVLVTGGVLVALAGISIFQLANLPSDQVMPAVMGSTWDKCPWRILALSVPGLIAVLLVMRSFAPTRPALAGAGAGLFVGGVAATIYGLHCAETSAMFTLIWYTGGIAASALIGALAGWRILRW